MVQNRNYQKNPITRIENLGGTLVLGMCPNSGKTVVTILGIDAYLKKNPKERWLVVAHSTNVIKKNFTDSLRDLKNDISFTWSTDLSDDSQVHVIITANEPHVTQKYNNVVVDEAHENYLANKQSKEQVQRLIKKIGAKNQLLLTGTPSKFINEGGYNIEIVSLLDMPKDYMSTLGVELIETRYNWRGEYTRGGSLRESAFGSMVDSERAMESITLEILKKIKHGLTAQEFNKVKTLKRIKGGAKSIMVDLFGKIMKRTMFVCGSISQADDVNLILNNNGVSSYVSHSESDESSELFDNFKDGKFNVLVVVNRGRLGYSDNDLYNIVDMSGTHNPDLIYQMFARVLRGTPKQQKFYYKVTTQEPGMRSLTHMSTCAALMLTDKNFLSTFNGKNFNGMKIPMIASTKTPSIAPGKKSVSKPSDKLRLPEFTNDIVDFMRNVIADNDKPTSVYKMTSIGDVRKMLGDMKQHSAGHWSKERCIEEAKKYSKPYDLHRENRVVYQIMRENKWMDEVWPGFVYKVYAEKVSIERTISLLEKGECKSLSEFSKKYNKPYHLIKDNEEIKDKYFPNRRVSVNSKKNGRVYWTKEKCIEASKECSSRYDMEKKYKTAINSLRTKWPEELDKLFPNPGRKTKWTKEEIVKVAKKCSHREDMRQKYKQAYAIMNKSYIGLSEELFGKKNLGLNRNNRLNIR
jgi:superfamily II DNA or RNA helicase